MCGCESQRQELWQAFDLKLLKLKGLVVGIGTADVQKPEVAKDSLLGLTSTDMAPITRAVHMQGPQRSECGSGFNIVLHYPASATYL